MTTKATYSGAEIHVIFSATMERSDYGVPGSPVWYEPADVEVETLSILGHDFHMDQLPIDLQNEIMTLADGLEWGRDE